MSKRLKDVADVYYGKRQNEVEDIYGAYPIYGTGGVFGRANRPLFKGPGIVVGRKGTLDNPQFVKGDFWAVDTAYAVLPTGNTHAKWLYYTLLRQDLASLNEATGVPSLNRDRLYNVPVGSFDPLDQARIAYVLDTIDEAIQKTEAVIAKLKQIRAGMLHDLLTYGLDQDGKLRDPIAHPEQFKDSELGRIPKEWEVVRCRNSFKLKSGIAKTQRELLKESKGDVPVFGGNGITGYTQTFLINAPTIVIGRVGEYCGKVHITPERAWITDNALYVTDLVPACTMTFLHRYLDWKDLTKLQSATGQPLITQRGIGETSIVLPQVQEQKAIVSALHSPDGLMLQETAELDKLHSLKSGLMDDLLSGNVSVPAVLLPEEVPA